MNLAFLCSYPMVNFYGGVPVVSNTLTRELQLKGYHVIFIAVTTPKEMFKDYDYIAKQYFINIEQQYCIIEKEFNYIINNENIDFIINQATYSWTYELLRSVSKGIIRISTIHRKPFETRGVERQFLSRWHPTSFKGMMWKYGGIVIPLIPRYFYSREAKKEYKEALKSSDYLCVLSRSFIDIINKRVQNNTNCKIISIGNPNTFKFIEKSTDKKENLILIVCRIEDRCKNISDFLYAWKNVGRYYPDWKVEIVGDGNDKERLQSLSSKLNLINIEFVGYKTNIADYYLRAKIVCVTSWFEGWNMSIAEGMMYGCVPVVYDTFESAYDMIDEDVSGFVVHKNTSQNLAKVLNNALAFPNHLRNMANIVSKKIETYSPERVVGVWNSLFIEISMLDDKR